MIVSKIGCVFEEFSNTKNSILLHCCNCYHTMGGGIAKVIAKKFPEAYKADLATPLGPEKLGSYSYCYVKKDLNDIRMIFNLYGQVNWSSQSRQLNYEGFYSALEKVVKDIECGEKFTFLFPHKIGSDLAKGNWNIVSTMIAEVFKGYNVVIVKLPNK